MKTHNVIGAALALEDKRYRRRRYYRQPQRHPQPTKDEFRKILEDPLKKFPEKEKFLEKSFNHVTKESLGIIKYIVRKRRLSLIGNIKEYFLKLYYEENNKLPITAIFAKELSETQREQLIQKLEKKYGKKIVLNLKVDKEIIGGGILKIGNEVINGSIKNQIDEIKKNF